MLKTALYWRIMLLDKDDVIQPDELQRAFVPFGHELTLDECLSMCKDVGGKDHLDFEDFVKLMKMPFIINDEDVDDQFEDELLNDADDDDEQQQYSDDSDGSGQ